MWVIFEGLDKAGKTTLEREFLKQTDYKHIVIDRGPVGYMVFDKIFNRSTALGDREFIKQARKINKSKDVFIVHCVVKKEVADERLKEHNEVCPYDYQKAQKIMKINMNRFYSKDHVILIDTTVFSIEKCVKLIIEKLNKFRRGEF